MKLSDGFQLLATSSNGVARLRELILSLAVQGRLVPQNQQEEPARALLDRIADEKQALALNGRSRERSHALTCSGQTEIRDLPVGWEWTSLSQIGLVSPRNKVADDARVSFVQMSSIPVELATHHVTEERLWSDIKSGFTHFAEGDVGVAKITPCFENGKSTVFRNLANGVGAGTTELHVVRPLGGVRPEYILIFLKSPAFLRNGESVMTGSAGQKRLPKQYFENTPFPLPPLQEQSRIAAKVHELMEVCNTLEAQDRLEAEQHARLVNTLFDALAASESPHALAENWTRVATHFDLLLDRPEAVDALERAIGHLAVRGLLVPQDSSDTPASKLLGEIRAKKAQLIAEGKIKREKELPVIRDEDTPFELPAGWTWARFPELGEFGRGKSKHRPRNDPALFNPGVYPLIQTGDVARADRLIERFNAQYSESGLAQSKLWPAGTLCITIAANIADSAILGFDACFPDSVVGFVPIGELVDARYLLTFIETAKDDLTAFAPSTAQKNINLEILNSVLIPVPPRDEMLRIVARVDELRDLCRVLRARLTARQTCQAHFAEALVEQAASAGSSGAAEELAAAA